MRLDENPIISTQLTLAKRYGLTAAMWATTILTAFVCWAFVQDLEQARRWSSNLARIAGDYTISITIMQFIVGLLGSVAVARSVAARRKDGALNADRLTPMTPSDLAAGYWLGPLIAPAMLMAFGTVIVIFISLVTPGVDITRVLLSQSIVYSTLVTVGIVGLWIGLEVRNPAVAPPLMLVALLMSPFSLGFGEAFVGHAALGFYAFLELSPSGFGRNFNPLVDPRLLTVGLQAAMVWLAWRGVTRKLANPQARGVRFAEAVGFAAALSCLQTAILLPGLVEKWTSSTYTWGADGMLAGGFVFASVMVLAAAFTTIHSPDSVRRALLREKRSDASVLLRSGLSAATLVGVIGAIALTALITMGPDPIDALGVVDLVLCSFALLAFLEGANVTGQRRRMVIALSVLAISCALPIVFAIAIDDDLAAMVPGVTGILSYTGELAANEATVAAAGGLYHAALAVGGFLFWKRGMKETFARVRSTSL